MLTIGQFARASGLTVKALHFYDSRGVLPPAEVDADTGYRRYRPEQLRRAGALHALRAADVPLDEARRLLEEPDRVDAALERLAADRTAARDRQDRAFAAARRVVALLDEEAPVGVRDDPGGEWTGLRWRAADGALPGQEWDAEVESLARVLRAGPEVPVGARWTVFRADREMLVCFPTSGRVPLEEVSASLGETSGELRQGRREPGREAWTRMSVDDLTVHGEVGVPPVALVALGEFLDEFGSLGEEREVRQLVVPGQDEAPSAVEFAAALPAGR